MLASHIVLGISTSGRSKNVIEALRMAKQKDAKTLVLTGLPGQPLGDVSDIFLAVPSKETSLSKNVILSLFILFVTLLKEL